MIILVKNHSDFTPPRRIVPITGDSNIRAGLFRINLYVFTDY